MGFGSFVVALWSLGMYVAVIMKSSAYDVMLTLAVGGGSVAHVKVKGYRGTERMFKGTWGQNGFLRYFVGEISCVRLLAIK